MQLAAGLRCWHLRAYEIGGRIAQDLQVLQRLAIHNANANQGQQGEGFELCHVLIFLQRRFYDAVYAV
jgi:hypothetical protein